MCNELKQVKDVEPVKEDNACFCGCVSSSESDYKKETTPNKKCCE